jgi:hypothetical protein
MVVRTADSVDGSDRSRTDLVVWTECQIASTPRGSGSGSGLAVQDGRERERASRIARVMAPKNDIIRFPTPRVGTTRDREAAGAAIFSA